MGSPLAEQPTFDEGEGAEAVVDPAVAMDDEAEGESSEGAGESSSPISGAAAEQPEHLRNTSPNASD